MQETFEGISWILQMHGRYPTYARFTKVQTLLEGDYVNGEHNIWQLSTIKYYIF